MSRKGEPIVKICPHCGDSFDAREKNKGRGIKRMMSQVFCSRRCMSRDRAKTHNQEQHHAWGGGIFDDNGYIRINKYLGNGKRKMPLQHDLVMEEHIGRKLKPDEVVHHVDRNRSNNDITSLQLMTRSEHSKLHYESGHYEVGVYKYVA